MIRTRGDNSSPYERPYPTTSSIVQQSPPTVHTGTQITTMRQSPPSVHVREIAVDVPSYAYPTQSQSTPYDDEYCASDSNYYSDSDATRLPVTTSSLPPQPYVPTPLSSHTQRPTSTSTLFGDGMNSDATTLSLPLHVPMDVHTYYKTMCKYQPLARKNLIVDQLWLRKGRKEEYEFVVAKVKHMRGHDIGNRLDCLVFERSLYSPIGSLSSSSAEHIVSQCREECFNSDGDRSSTEGIWQLKFYKSSESDSNIFLLEELLRLITIISDNSHIYSTDIDAPYWFPATIMETAQAIFPIHHGDKDKFGWLKRTLSRLNRPQSECGRHIVATYRNDKKKHRIPGPTPQAVSAVNSVTGSQTQ